MSFSVRSIIAFWTLSVCLLVHSNALAQSANLERVVTARFSDVSVEEVLSYLSAQGNFKFSYNSSLIDEDKSVELILVNKTIREAIGLLFKGTIRYKVQGQYVILLKAERDPVYISGVVYDAISGKKLPNVSIYERNSLASTVTNQNGYYRIKLNHTKTIFKLSVSGPEYESQTLVVKLLQSETKDWALQPKVKQQELPFDDNSPYFPNLIDTVAIPKEVPILVPRVPVTGLLLSEYSVADTTDNIFPIYRKDSSRLFRFWDEIKSRFSKMMIARTQRIHDKNVTDTLSRPFQLSLLPFLGTNKLLSGSIENRVSVNIVMGYSAGVRKMEFGGGLNGVRRNVNGFQFAGVGNIVGKNVIGVQMGGVFNTVLGETQGVAMTLGWNHTWKNMTGLQAAGLINITHKETRGAQLSGVLNVTGKLSKGLQMAPILNVVLKESKGWQVGLLNFSHKISKGGHQIGFLNFSDSSATAPIGFLSFVGKGNGYKRFEVAIDEIQSANITFKTGVPAFYNILTLGSNFVRAYELVNIGYGFGRAYKLGGRWMMNTDVTSGLMVEYNQYGEVNQGVLWRFDLGFEKFLARNSTLTFGPSIKALVIDPANSSYANGKPFKNMPTYQAIRSTERFTLWYGFQMGLRIKQRYGD